MGAYGRGMRVLVLILLFSLYAVGLGAAQSSGGAAEEVRVHQQRAHQLLNEKKPELAAKEFAAVLATDPHNLDAQASLGRAPLLSKKLCNGGATPARRGAAEA